VYNKSNKINYYQVRVYLEGSSEGYYVL